MKDLEKFKEFLSTPRKVVITTHHKPDADALGSSLALHHYLVSKGHISTVITPTDYPDFLKWMHGEKDVINFEEKEKEATQIINNYDLVCCLDFSALNRINELGEIVRAAPAKKLLIDHHRNPEDFADFSFWDVTRAATAELVYEIILNLGDKKLITKEIGACIYAGIMTDTGSFRHPSTTKRIHEIAAEIIELGVNTPEIHRLIYDTSSEDKLRFLGFALSEKLVVLKEFKTAYISITDEELKKFNSKTGDTEGLVNYALSIDDVVFAAVIIDRVKAIKISFRSVGTFSVADFASNHFNGGGHFNAAGGMTECSLEKTVAHFEALLPQYKESLLKSI